VLKRRRSMSVMTGYDDCDGLALAALLRSREVSMADVCEEAIRRVEAVNPRLNAVVTRCYEAARDSVRRGLPEGPFHGVPFLLKDLVEVAAGLRLTMGSRAYRDYIPDFDSEMVVRFRDGGLVILGKTNVPELGIAGVTEPELHGPCRNPWNPERTPGGSSGGSAAAVAAGVVPLASGNDGGGSIRIPAACCGLFGLKPSRGRNPTGPATGELWQGLAASHVLTRSVRDSAAALDLTHGPDPGAPGFLPAPQRPFLEEVVRDPKPMRIGFSTESPFGTVVHPECASAVRNAAEILEGLGHAVEEARPEIGGRRLLQSFLCLVFGETYADLRLMGKILGRPPRPSDVEPLTWTIARLGKAVSAGELSLARRAFGAAGRAMGRFHQRYDLFLTPTLGEPPWPVGELSPGRSERLLLVSANRLRLGGLVKAVGIPGMLALRTMTKFPFTQLANATGQPAMSVPLHWTADGLPCGVQFVAPLGEEARLFRLAGQLERERPWAHRRPPIWAGTNS
jgi:amidase